jgi:hypothetical protein
MPVWSHFKLFDKDIRDLFMLCIVFMCQLNRILFIIVAHLFCSLFDFSFILCSTFVSIRFFCFSLFAVQKRKIQF